VKVDFLKKLTHLKLEDKSIAKIQALEACEKVRVLYLFDNCIRRIENLGFARSLTHLYLQNNQITKIEGLETLGNLTKLHLDGNAINCVEGLDALPRLEELTLSKQRLDPSKSHAAAAAALNEAEPGRFVDAGGMLFDMASIATIAQSLRVLELADNGLNSVAHLCYLGGLQDLVLSGNQIADKQVRPPSAPLRLSRVRECIACVSAL
jgi:Leucine-rich repeat (LRR) protein